MQQLPTCRADAAQPEYVALVRGIGYRLIPQVKAAADIVVPGVVSANGHRNRRFIRWAVVGIVVCVGLATILYGFNHLAPLYDRMFYEKWAITFDESRRRQLEALEQVARQESLFARTRLAEAEHFIDKVAPIEPALLAIRRLAVENNVLGGKEASWSRYCQAWLTLFTGKFNHSTPFYLSYTQSLILI